MESWRNLLALDDATLWKSIDVGAEIRSLSFSSHDGHLAVGTVAADAAEQHGVLKLWDVEFSKGGVELCWQLLRS